MLDRDKAISFYPAEYVEELNSELEWARRANAGLEQLRPVWAEGWSSDSMAAQASANIISDFYELLGVDNYHDAKNRLKYLLLLEVDKP
ncbi:hypothetical protein B0E33_01480 [Roseibium algicola]|uniref:Uncharacterized protein n=1 Tax=Roseibium algicola TaxID=2857014 RepID=A0ABM6HWL8_9HYPH|nr:hypothetical protein [Roseibium aggregatum]AQQ02427.1 hypothetical protein B0E33_01480 [Roseibium aggregatum]